MKKIKLVIIAAAVVTLTSVNAQSLDGKFYGGAEFGSSKLSDDTKSGTAALVSAFGGSASATQDSSVSNYRIFGGYKVNENVDLELGYIQTSSFSLNFSGRSGGGVAYTGGISAKVAGYDYSVLLRPSIATSYNNVFFRIGQHHYSTDTSGSISAGGSSASFNDSKSGNGTIFGIGYDATIDKDIDVRLSVNRLAKISGDSDSSATVYSVGLLKRF
jgi:hypothetical protein